MDYPKAKYRRAGPGEDGDQVGKFNGGRHSYVSAVVADEEEEKALGEGWHDFPDMTDRPKDQAIAEVIELIKHADADVQTMTGVVESPRRGPGRPRKVEAEE